MPLRVVPSRKGRSDAGRLGRLLADRRRVLNIVSVSMVVTSLLVVVVAQALLANGQVRFSSLQHELSLEQSSHRQEELAVSQLETPPRIVGAATSQGMVHPGNVVELPYVPLTVPVATPKVTAAPAAPPAATPPPPTNASSGGAATGATTGTGTSSSTTTATSTP